MRDLRHAGEGLEGEHFLISHLVRVGIEALAQHRLQIIASGLRVGPENDVVDPATLLPVPRPAARPASRAQVRALIAELLDERGLVESMKTAFAGERAAQLDMADWMGQTAKFTRPMFTFDALRMLEQDEVFINAAGKPDWPATKAFLADGASAKPQRPAPGPEPFGPRRRAQAAADRLHGRSKRHDGHDRLDPHDPAEHADAGRPADDAVSLAARLYHADHGQWPPTLEALVPQYLAEVPRDPMAPGGRAYGYLLLEGGLPDGGDRPLVYSVGDDGVDDSARGGIPTTPWFGWHRGRDECAQHHPMDAGAGDHAAGSPMTGISTHSPFTREEPTWPQPPRFWWLKRLTLGLVLLPVA